MAGRTLTRQRVVPALAAAGLIASLLGASPAPAAANGISLGPLGTQRPPEPAGFLLDAASADRCDFLDPHACLLPFPSDQFTRPDPTAASGRRLALHPASMPRNIAGKPVDPTEWNRNDGFSPGQPLLVKVPDLDPAQSRLPSITNIEASLSKRSPVVVINAETGERHPVWAELDANVTGTSVRPYEPPHVVPQVVREEGPSEIDEAVAGFEDAYREAASNLPPEVPEETAVVDPEPSRLLIIRPAVNWEEGARYIVALRRLRRADGSEIDAETIFRAYRDRRPTPLSVLGVGPFEGRRPHMEALLHALKREAKVHRRDLYLAWDFTVASEQNLSERMLHIRDESFDELGGAAPAFQVTSVQDFASGDVLRRVQGSFDVPRWVSTPTTGARMLYDPVAAREGRFVPLRQPTPQPATFTCNIPRSTVAGGVVDPAVPSLYGHGLLGSQSEVNSGAQTNFGNLHNFAFCATDWIGMAFEDIPSVASILTDMSNFALIPDRLQQAMLNFLWLGRLMVHPEGFASHPAFRQNGSPLITSDLVYMGNSQGGIIGGSLTAVATDFTRSILGVPGMNYSTLLHRSVDYDPFEEVVNAVYQDEMERVIIYSLIQILWDRGEANGYAHHMTGDPLPGTPPHQVVLEAAFGDHQVAIVSAEVEARTIGAAAHVPAPALHTTPDPYELLPAITYPYVGSALMEWDSGTLAPPDENVPPDPAVVGPDPHEFPRRDVHARRLRNHFLRTGEIIDVCTGSGDVEGDPWTWPPPRNERDLASCRTARYAPPGT